MEAPFKKGQKVIYLGDRNGFKEVEPNLKKNNVYTVFYSEYSRVFTVSAGKDWFIQVEEDLNILYWHGCFAPIPEQRERINYVAVSETLREKAIETVITQTN